jgi:hypothetical protein
MRKAAQMLEVQPALGGDLAHALVGLLAAWVSFITSSGSAMMSRTSCAG